MAAAKRDGGGPSLDPGTLARLPAIGSGAPPAPPDLSIVIVSFETRDRLADCIASLLARRDELSLEIVVVDNGSADGSAEMLAARPEFSSVTLLRNDRNLGYAAACNRGLRRASGRKLLLLNPDTEVPAGALSALAHHLDSHLELGIVGPRLVRRDGTLDLACRRSFPTPLASLFRFAGLSRLFPRSPLFGRYNLTYRDPLQSYAVDALVGACMMCRREAAEALGPLDESYFMYGEDLDWCWRARERGIGVGYLGSVAVWHEKRASSRQRPVRMNFYFHRAMLLFHAKHLRDRYPAWLNALVSAAVGLRFAAFAALHLLAAPARALAARRRRFNIEWQGRR